MLGLSVAKVVDRVDAAHGIRLGSAAVLRMEHWAAEALGAVYESPEAQLRHVPGVHGDVTSFRLNGDDGWAWVFVTVTAFVFRINPSRG